MVKAFPQRLELAIKSAYDNGCTEFDEKKPDPGRQSNRPNWRGHERSRARLNKKQIVP